MTLQTLKPSFLAAQAERVRALRDDLRNRYALWQTYHRTRAELDGMTDRELSDIGIARADIGDIARKAVYGG